uniref:Uncharacterized protein n=1 Tax=Anguilla anguilla TaxID=7936 RepID=A0A0E9WC68_ANGAN
MNSQDIANRVHIFIKQRKRMKHNFNITISIRIETMLQSNNFSQALLSLKVVI